MKKIENKKFVVGLIILIILSGVFIVYSIFGRSEVNRGLFTPITAPQNITVNKLNINKLPSAIPVNSLLEKNTLITENDTITSIDKPGVTQYTRKFISKKSVDENYTIYKKYLKNNGWKILSSLENKNLRSLVATKADNSQRFLITISENSVSHKVSVDLTVMINK